MQYVVGSLPSEPSLREQASPAGHGLVQIDRAEPEVERSGSTSTARSNDAQSAEEQMEHVVRRCAARRSLLRGDDEAGDAGDNQRRAEDPATVRFTSRPDFIDPSTVPCRSSGTKRSADLIYGATYVKCECGDCATTGVVAALAALPQTSNTNVHPLCRPSVLTSSPADRLEGADVLLTFPTDRASQRCGQTRPVDDASAVPLVVIHSSTHETPLALSATAKKLPPAPVSVSSVPTPVRRAHWQPSMMLSASTSWSEPRPGR